MHLIQQSSTPQKNNVTTNINIYYLENTITTHVHALFTLYYLVYNLHSDPHSKGQSSNALAEPDTELLQPTHSLFFNGLEERTPTWGRTSSSAAHLNELQINQYLKHTTDPIQQPYHGLQSLPERSDTDQQIAHLQPLSIEKT